MSAPPAASPARPPSFAEASRFWLKLGFISFGGPAGQIAILHQEVVERRRWLEEARFLHALNFCMLLPGPEAQQLATYLGWLLHGTRGGLVAGILFVLPSALILWALSYGYVVWGTLPWVVGLFSGLKPAVLAIVVAAVWRIGTKVLKNDVMFGLAALAFVALFFGEAPFPWVVLLAGLVGWLGGRFFPGKFCVLKGHGNVTEQPGTLLGRPLPAPTVGRAIKVCLVAGGLWWAPVLLTGVLFHWSGSLCQQGLFFSKAALVTFGGAYAVLPYVSQQAVQHYGWLTPGQMLDGLGLAETTPGPLIMVLQFVGFVGAWQHPGTLSPLLAATLGAALTTWTTFAPSFLWVFLGGPYIERLRGQVRLNAALSAITAAIVGVILNLALWFGLQVLWPAAGRFDLTAAVISLVVLVGLVRWRWNVIAVIGGSALVGLARSLFIS